MVRAELGFTESVILCIIFLVILKPRVHLNLTRLHLCKLAIFKNIKWGSRITWLFLWEEVCTDAKVSVVPTSSNKLSSVSDATDWVRSHFDVASCC